MAIADIFLGIDLGTSSVRCTAINENEDQLAASKVELPLPENPGNGQFNQDPVLWWDATLECLIQLGNEIPLSQVTAISVDGTSSTVLLTGKNNQPVSQALMYNDSRSAAMLERVEDIIPQDHLTRSASSSLLKSLWLLNNDKQDDSFIAHQADWILGKLTGTVGVSSAGVSQVGVSDENNCLKLGFDSILKKWPGWMQNLPFDVFNKLPKVHATSEFAGHICESVAKQTGLLTSTRLYFGTTDSTASTLATGVTQEGQAVTTLGTTLVMKTLTAEPVNNFKYGLYSHCLPNNLWLTGGASNAGGNILLQYFSIEEVEQLSRQINPDEPTGLDYYPLSAPGERFPKNDPQLSPCLEPRPSSDVLFLTAIFEGLASIEKLGYEKINELSGTEPKEIITSGGKAANNLAFTAIRQRILGIPVKTATFTEASYGSALIAKPGWCVVPGNSKTQNQVTQKNTYL